MINYWDCRAALAMTVGVEYFLGPRHIND